MIRSPAATFARTQGSIRSGVPISSSAPRARSGAPPCSGPENAPIAATTAAATSAPVAGTTPAGEVGAADPGLDRGARTPLPAPPVAGRRLRAGAHPRPVGGGGEVGTRLERL